MEFSNLVKNNLTAHLTSFYLAIVHSEETELVSYISKRSKIYNIQGWILAKETSLTTHKETNGEHFHIVLFHFSDNELLNKKHSNSIMRHFVNKYELAGNSQGDKVRQYGLIKKSIRSVEKIIRYTTKDHKFICDPKSLQEIVDTLPNWETDEENTTQNFMKTILDEVKRQPLGELNNDYSIIKFILDYYRKNNKHPPPRSVMDKYLKIINFDQIEIFDFINKYYL